jgi:ComF family protein
MTSEIAFSAVRSWAYFEEPLQSAIHRLKYHRDIGLGNTLALPLIKLLEMNGWQIDMVVPIPLDAERFKQRGYNQSALLAKPIAWESGVRYFPNALHRIRETQQQVGLNRDERRTNMLNAFVADKKWVKDKSVLLVDDVITTGATMNSSARSLMQTGAKAVYGLTLARSAHLY